MRSLRIFFASLVVFVVIALFILYKRYLTIDDVVPSLESPGADSKGVTHSTGRDEFSSPNGRNNSWFKFFLLAPPEYTTSFLVNHTKRASDYYKKHLNEESAEIWLHRGFEQMIQEQTTDPNMADVILIAGYFHLHAVIYKTKETGGRKGTADLSSLFNTYTSYLTRIHSQDPTIKSKPLLLLIPSWNPSVANTIGITGLVKLLQDNGYENLWSVGFERNPLWQGLPPERIIPIPYVVRVDPSTFANDSSSLPKRKTNSIFYAGDLRPHAKLWAGCHRDKLLLPLLNSTSSTTHFDVQLVKKKNRMDQAECNHRMTTSDYCLILCGDTPSSRTLTSAMVSGCIPIRVGSRLRGLCEAPCHGGFGWKPTTEEYTHLPFSESIPWDFFPEIDEQEFMDAGEAVVNALLRTIDSIKKENLRFIMNATRNGWMYGWGDPIHSTNFGDATKYIWQSFLANVQD